MTGWMDEEKLKRTIERKNEIIFEQTQRNIKLMKEIKALREALEACKEKVGLGVTFENQEQLIRGLEYIRNEVAEICRQALAKESGK